MLRRTHTYTFAALEVSPTTFAEIEQKLRDAGYHHAFDTDCDGRATIDMNGIGLVADQSLLPQHDVDARRAEARRQRNEASSDRAADIVDLLTERERRMARTENGAPDGQRYPGAERVTDRVSDPAS